MLSNGTATTLKPEPSARRRTDGGTDGVLEGTHLNSRAEGPQLKYCSATGARPSHVVTSVHTSQGATVVFSGMV